MKKVILALAALLALLLLSMAGGSALADNGHHVFIVTCTSSHSNYDDPIVHPGQPGASHEHTFSGNDTTNAFSTYASMQAGSSSCDDPGDKAGYWSPTLRDPNGRDIVPLKVFGYYRNTPATSVLTQPFPADFRIVAGGINDRAAVTYKCFISSGGQGPWPASGVPRCDGAGNYLVQKITFPNCITGATDSPDHRSHAIHVNSGPCPAAYPIKVPELGLNFRWCINCGGPGYVFSDGETIPHADFWNTWIQSRLEQRVHDCLNNGVNC